MSTQYESGRWSYGQYFAMIGVPFLVWNAWTVIAWLTDGPTQIIQYRDRDDPSWYAARFYEGLMILVALAVLVYVVRGCRREGRFLTWDVMFCLCGATIFWADAAHNVFQPVILMSSQWVNLNNTCGHMPFVVNPECGAVPDAILFNGLAGTFGILGAAVVATAGLRCLRLRKPHLSTAQLLGVVVLFGLLVDALYEVPLIALNLLTYTTNAGPIPLGHHARFALVELLQGGLVFALLVWLRYHRNDRGETIPERGLDRLRPGPRKAVTLLALYGFVQTVNWIPGSLPMMAASFFQSPWPEMPAHLLNGVCDHGDVQGTAYGPCPGSPNFHIPGRQSR